MNKIEDTILLQYLNEVLDEKGIQAVEAWVSESDDHRKYLEKLYYATEVVARYNALKRANTNKSLVNVHKKINSHSHHQLLKLYWRRTAVGVAAFLVGAVMMLGYFHLTNQSTDYIVQTAEGDCVKVFLPDGSFVNVNENTSLSYHHGLFAKDREVELNGEAYFEVKHDKSHPFVVFHKGISAKVLGTKFNIQTKKNLFIATLIQGSLEISQKDKKEDFLMKPNQQVIVDMTTHDASMIDISDGKESIFWVTGRMSYKDKRLEEIVESLKSQYDIQVQFANDAVKNQRFTCTFSTENSVEDIFKILSMTHRFVYQIDKDTIFIE